MPNISINNIKPDTNQPRKIFDEKHIQGLTKSLEVEGMINPIEVDTNNIIITGECRWRAAVKLGWTEVPVLVNKKPYTEYQRLRHQMAENVHQSGSSYDTMMNPLDTARGYDRLLRLSGYNRTPGGRLESPVSKLAEEIGIAKSTIFDYLDLLDESPQIQKAIVEGLPRTYIREANDAPIKIRQQLKEKIVRGDYPNRDSLSQDIILARKIPDLALLEIERIKAKESITTNKILNGVTRLALALESLPMNQLDVREKGIIIKQLEWLIKEITKYLF